ncbi:MAG: MFS transporter [Rhodospirillaceae bacterium]|nr:MFS transporter [Rhodospirillaceae bacterium]
MTVDAAAAPSPNRLPTWLCLGYGTGMIGAQIFRDAPAFLLLIFMTDTLGIPAATAGLAIFIPKIWVVFADPLAGLASDRISTRWGRRRPFMLVGGGLTVVGILALFNVPDLPGPTAKAVYITAVYTLALTAFAAFSVPYLTMGSEMTSDYHERTRVMAYRVAFMATGLIVSGYAAAIREYGGPGEAGFTFMAFVIAAICLVTMMTTVFSTARAPFYDRHTTAMSLGEQVRLALANRPFLVLLAAAFLERLAEGIGYAVLIYFQTYVLQNSATVLGNMIFVLCLPTILSQGLWVWVTRRIGKMRTHIIVLLLYCVTVLFWLAAAPDRVWVTYVVAFFSGLFNGAFILTALSMLTDAVTYDRLKTGLNREGAYTGVWLAAEKVAFALGTLIVGIVLSLFGYIETDAATPVTQPDSALTGMTIAYVAMPIFFHLLSLVFLVRFRLTEADLTPRA